LTDMTKSQLNTILSTLVGEPRNPNTKDAALKAIAKHGEPLGLTVEEILDAADSLLEGRMSPEQFRDSMQRQAAEDPEPTSEAKPRNRRDGTKQATMIAMLRRPEGATVAQVAEFTGWANHTIRGVIAGALKKKLGLTITTERVRNLGPNKGGGRGSYTIYRVVDAA